MKTSPQTNNVYFRNITMVVIFSRGNNQIEVNYEMLDRPPRMRASNSVRRWELLQLEDQTEHLFAALAEEIIEAMDLKLNPEEIRTLAKKYYDKDDATEVGFALHHEYGDKCNNLSVSKYCRLHTRFMINHVSLAFTVLTENSIKFRISPYVTRYHA